MLNPKQTTAQSVPFFALLAVILLSGCSEHMALKPDTTALDTRTKSVAIFTVLTKNNLKPDYPIFPNWIYVESVQSGSTEFITDGDWDRYNTDGRAWAFKGENEYPVSLALAPGRYKIGVVRGGATNFILFWQFQFPLEAEFDVPPGSVVYLGNVVMANRERKGNEPKSGSMFPLIDQGVSGIADGTMDITISDHSSKDIPHFLAKYPCLQGIPIKTAIMVKR